MIEPPCTEPYARWCERSANQLMVSLLLDLNWENSLMMVMMVMVNIVGAHFNQAIPFVTMLIFVFELKRHMGYSEFV